MAFSVKLTDLKIGDSENIVNSIPSCSNHDGHTVLSYYESIFCFQWMELRSRGGFVALSTLCLMIVLSSYLLLSEDQSIPIERLSRYSDDEEDLAESMRSVLQQSGAELPK